MWFIAIGILLFFAFIGLGFYTAFSLIFRMIKILDAEADKEIKEIKNKEDD